ncbi:MAG: LacI family transcriptional regulator [Paracoccaceae bacterium]|nr:MAG: LacI family transcriptional regulator [Paracoccaceae bacterium]
MVTIKDIGRALGLSHATVSRALNDSPYVSDSTRALVRRKAEEMGYRPDHAARSLRGSASNLVGFVLPDIRNDFYARIGEQVARSIADRQLQLVLSITDDDPRREERQIAELARMRPRAVILTPTSRLTARAAEMLSRMRLVQMVRRHPALAADLVVADDREAVAAATRLMLATGHRRIAYIGGGEQTLSTGTARLAGYRAALREAGLADDGLCALGPPQPGFGLEAGLRLLSATPPPDAVVLGSSQLTTGFLAAAARAGRSVPGELSLIAYDDPDWFAHWGPGISAVVLPSASIARAVAAFACGEDPPDPPLRIEPGPGAARSLVYPIAIARRGSVIDRRNGCREDARR